MWCINLAYAIRRCEASRKQKQFFARVSSITITPCSSLITHATRALAAGWEKPGAGHECAIELDKALRKLALDDEDLKPLWDWITTLE